MREEAWRGEGEEGGARGGGSFLEFVKRLRSFMSFLFSSIFLLAVKKDVFFVSSALPGVRRGARDEALWLLVREG